MWMVNVITSYSIHYTKLYDDEYGFWGYNAAAEYNDGYEHQTTLYAIDNFRVTPNLNVSYGANIRYQNINGNHATNRGANWTLATAEIENFNYDFYNYTANRNNFV